MTKISSHVEDTLWCHGNHSLLATVGEVVVAGTDVMIGSSF